MQQTDAATSAISDRQDAILTAAFHSFATYGYRRTSMEDIAKAAEISRTALYVHYRSKEDIFKSLATRYFATAIQDLRLALAATGKAPAETMIDAFIAKDGKFMDVVLGTPHGRELLDAGFSVSADIAENGEAAMCAELAVWMSGFKIADGMGTATDLAETLWSALKGLKLNVSDMTTYRAGQARLARIFALALTSQH